MEDMKSIIISFLSVLFLGPSFVYSQEDLDDLYNGFNWMIKSDVVYNHWIPSTSYSLDYYTEGIQYYRFESVITHDLSFLPDIKFAWETNFNKSNQVELLEEHSSASGLEDAYNKIMLIAGFGKHTGLFNPWRTNSFFDLSYSKETFYIKVRPNEDEIYYAPFSQDEPKRLLTGNDLGMFTKFQEIQGTFNTEGIAILPAIMGALFGGGTDIMTFDGLDTRLGLYFATFHKPFMMNQIATYGWLSGDQRTLYDARFNAFGLVEKWGYYGKYFIFDMQNNLGIAFINLREDETLSDSQDPVYFHYKLATSLGFHLPLWNSRVNFSAMGSFLWSFMWGGVYSNETEVIETQSFLNGDMIFKINGSLTINI